MAIPLSTRLWSVNMTAKNHMGHNWWAGPNDSRKLFQELVQYSKKENTDPAIIRFKERGQISENDTI